MEIKNILIVVAFIGLAVVLSERDQEAGSQAVEPTPAEERADVRSDPTGDFLVSISRVGDDEIRWAGFRLNEPLEVRMYGIGEGLSGTMYDYGWLVDADTRERVWTMEYGHTDHAGGADKNRVHDEVIHLDPGNYVAYYTSDGSHSYRDWNAASPDRGDLWGLSIVPVTGPVPEGVVAPYEPADDPNLVARITMVRDDEEREVIFTLEEETRLRVHALGEGSGGSMFDFGWISNARTGRRVWSMAYDATEWAGGATKNRLIDQVIVLPAGRYGLHYRTDGSHSFNEWNSAPPTDPMSWGVTVLRD